MIPIPTCLFSQAQSYKFCNNPDCQVQPFICKNCELDCCENVHMHKQKKIFTSWSQLSGLIDNYFNIEKYKEQVHKIEQTIVKQIIVIMKKSIEQFLVTVKQLFNGTSIQEKNKETIQKLKTRNYKRLGGRSMKQLYQKLLLSSSNKIKSDLSKKLNDFKTSVNIIKDQFKKISTGNKSQKNIKEPKIPIKIPVNLSTQDKFKFNKYSQKLLRNPNNSIAYFNLGLLFKKLNDIKEAEIHYTKSIQSNPNNTYAYLNRGNINLSQKKYKQAELDYTQTILQKPNYADAYYNRGLSNLGQNKIIEAYQDFTKCIEFDQKNSDCYFHRGNISFRLNKFSEAEQNYTKAIEINPKYYYFLKRAELFKKLNKSIDSIRDKQKAEKLKLSVGKN